MTSCAHSGVFPLSCGGIVSPLILCRCHCEAASGRTTAPVRSVEQETTSCGMNAAGWIGHYWGNEMSIGEVLGRLWKWLLGTVGDALGESTPPPRPRFEGTVITGTPPKATEVGRVTFYVVARNGSGMWALFRCPCGCNEVVTLSLQNAHHPHWTLEMNSSGRPTLYPSIWRDVGCFSHFWVRDGRVHWVPDTGSKPRIKLR